MNSMFQKPKLLKCLQTIIHHQIHLYSQLLKSFHYIRNQTPRDLHSTIQKGALPPSPFAKTESYGRAPRWSNRPEALDVGIGRVVTRSTVCVGCRTSRRIGCGRRARSRSGGRTSRGSSICLSSGRSAGRRGSSSCRSGRRIGRCIGRCGRSASCRSGRRSDAATRILMEQGYDRVYNVLGGYLAYPKK